MSKFLVVIFISLTFLSCNKKSTEYDSMIDGNNKNPALNRENIQINNPNSCIYWEENDNFVTIYIKMFGNEEYVGGGFISYVNNQLDYFLDKYTLFTYRNEVYELNNAFEHLLRCPTDKDTIRSILKQKSFQRIFTSNPMSNEVWFLSGEIDPNPESVMMEISNDFKLMEIANDLKNLGGRLISLSEYSEIELTNNQLYRFKKGNDFYINSEGLYYTACIGDDLMYRKPYTNTLVDPQIIVIKDNEYLISSFSIQFNGRIDCIVLARDVEVLFNSETVVIPEEFVI